MIEQITMAAEEFAKNPEPRCPCCLLLDVSASMSGRPISELNTGIRLYHDELLADPLASKRVQVAIVTFGGEVRTVQHFYEAPNFTPPELEANGDTPMGAGIVEALRLIEEAKQACRDNGIAYYRPWLLLITDGAPTDNYKQAVSPLHNAIRTKAVSFFAIGVQGADFSVLRELSLGRDPLKLDGLKFRELFQWLSNSQRSVSRSAPGQHQIALPSPMGPEGWATVDV